MKKTLFLAAAVVCAAFLLVSCNNTTGNNSNAGGNNNNAAASGNNNNASKPADSKPSASPATAGGGDIGIAECDEYLKKYEACVSDKVPEAARAQLRASLETTRKSWRDLAANPQTKGTLATACKQAHDTAKTSMSAYGCSW